MHPILFEYGPITIRFYGLMYVVAIIAGSFLIKSEVRRKKIPLSDDDVMSFVMWSVLGGILGARAYYVVFNLDYYLAYPKEIPAIWHGGLAIHGGLMGGATGAWMYLRRRAVPYLRMADAAAPSLILGQAFGRFGNFMNGDAHGMPTDLPWGIVFPADSIAGTEYPATPLHPVMLYEMAINLGIFSLLWFCLRKRGHKDGFILAVYLILYSSGRFLVEFLRADSLMLGPLKAAQVVSLALVLTAGWFVFRKKLWRT